VNDFVIAYLPPSGRVASFLTRHRGIYKDGWWAGDRFRYTWEPNGIAEKPFASAAQGSLAALCGEPAILLWKSASCCYSLSTCPRSSIVLLGWPDPPDSSRKGIRFNEAFCIA
jgi:hypothetical protein